MLLISMLFPGVTIRRGMPNLGTGETIYMYTGMGEGPSHTKLQNAVERLEEFIGYSV